LKDTYRHKGLRRQLVEELAAKGIKNPDVLDVMQNLPRHFFLDKAFEEWAYTDKAFPIGSQQTISQPYTVAYMTQALAVEKRQNILEIGTGSGYQACVLALLGGRVHTLERQEELYLKTKTLLKELNFQSIRTYFRDGSMGLPEFSPFDRILVTAASPVVPEFLKQQLAEGGILVLPVGDETSQQMLKITRLNATEFKVEKLDFFRFVPFLKGVNKKV
jgi:protein-L-isoaspartate(D-aspartate) O-methyltransferase